MRPGIAFVSALMLCALVPSAMAGEAEELLERAFARAAAEEAAFKPFHARTEEHYWVRESDGALKEEGRHWQRAVRWSADSTQVLEEGSEILFKKDETEEEKAERERRRQEDSGDDEGEDGRMELNFLDAARRKDYRYAFAGWETRGGRPLAAFTLESAQKKKDRWEGLFWLDPETAGLRAVDLSPVKKRVGLKSLRLRGEFRDFDGTSQPESMEMDVEVKVPLVVHIKIRTEIRFDEYRLVGPQGGAAR